MPGLYLQVKAAATQHADVVIALDVESTASAAANLRQDPSAAMQLAAVAAAAAPSAAAVAPSAAAAPDGASPAGDAAAGAKPERDSSGAATTAASAWTAPAAAVGDLMHPSGAGGAVAPADPAASGQQNQVGARRIWLTAVDAGSGEPYFLPYQPTGGPAGEMAPALRLTLTTGPHCVSVNSW